MKLTATILQALVVVCGLIQIALGLAFWTDNALTLVPIHMLVGLVLVLSLLTLAILAAFRRVAPGFVALAIVWSFVVPIFGFTQTQLLPGSAHWVIQVLHLLVGLAAIGMAQGLAARIRERQTLRDNTRQATITEDR